jgi:c-di-GMP-binding flagellar brake protein YcgR
MSRSATEIARVLEKVRSEGVLVTAYFPSLTFQSLLLVVDAVKKCIVLEPSVIEEANQALLSRPRCTFHCEMAGWHVEFVAAQPRALTLPRRTVIQCGFPELLASNYRRQHERVRVTPPLPLRIQADAAGIMPFDGMILDVAAGGVGFLLYASSITLEPATLLRGCRIQLPNARTCVTDLEVRYSQAVTLPNGRRATRSGCRFLNPSPELVALIKRLLHDEPD